MASPRVIVLDVETTGTDRRRDQIVELCVQFGAQADAPRRVWRIRPSVPISPGAQAVHGISLEDLAHCPDFAAVAGDVRSAIAGADVIIGYNLAFDIEMLQAEFDRVHVPPVDLGGKYIIDALRLWQQCEPRSLGQAHRRFVGDWFDEAHSAAGDVAATARVLQGMVRAFGLGEEDWERIAAACEPRRDRWIGPSGHVQWSDGGEPVIGFGRHRGTPIHDLARGDAGYLRWMQARDFPRHVHDICARAAELDRDQFVRWICRAFGSPPGASVGGPVAGRAEPSDSRALV